MSLNLALRYRLAAKARLRWDAARDAHFLLYPERGLKLNATAYAIVSGCDGTLSVGALLERVARDFDVPVEQIQRDAIPFMNELVGRGLLLEVTP